MIVRNLTASGLRLSSKFTKKLFFLRRRSTIPPWGEEYHGKGTVTLFQKSLSNKQMREVETRRSIVVLLLWCLLETCVERQNSLFFTGPASRLHTPCSKHRCRNVKSGFELTSGQGQKYSSSQSPARTAKSAKSMMSSQFKSAGSMSGTSNRPVPSVATYTISGSDNT